MTTSRRNPDLKAPPLARRRFIVNADDFGRSPAINAAVIRAHREGILTTTSLMVNEPACAEAVALARQNPRLGVGLHLTLLCGHSALPSDKIPGLVNNRQEFPTGPAGAGFRYFFCRCLREQLRAEIHAQFQKFRATGLPLDHVNGHLHLHLHPVIFRILMEDAEALGIERVRLTFDPFWLNLRLASATWPIAPSTPSCFISWPPAPGRSCASVASATRRRSLASCRMRAWTRPTCWRCCRACRPVIRSFTPILPLTSLRTSSRP